MSVIISEVDVGWGYRLTHGLTRIALISHSNRERNWPPDELLQLDRSLDDRGTWGTFDRRNPNLGEFENEVLASVEEHIEDRTFIILPEFAGSRSIEEKIQDRLNNKNKKCIVIAGSYYRTLHRQTHPANAPDLITESICPVLIPNHGPFYQRKFVRSPIENPGFEQPEQRVLLVFKNTGFGDFSILICSDALDTEYRSQYTAHLRGRIDFLIVPARNPASILPEQLQTLADNERWIILYCNGHGSNDGQVISPYHSNISPRITDSVATINLREFQDDLADKKSTKFHTPTQTERIFPPTPRHWPYRGDRPIDFAKHLKVIAVGSHFDDVWLGCSGTLMRLREHYDAQILVVTLCNVYPHDYFERYSLIGITLDNLHNDIRNLCSALGFQHREARDGWTFVDRSFEESVVRSYLKKLSEELRETDIVFIPRQDDLHRDHIITAKATLTEFRNVDILEYEIKDFRRLPFYPNVLADLSVRSNSDINLHGRELPTAGKSFAEKKAIILENAFRIMDPNDLPHSFQKNHTLGRMAFRASQSGANLMYAEAFVMEIII